MLISSSNHVFVRSVAQREIRIIATMTWIAWKCRVNAGGDCCSWISKTSELVTSCSVSWIWCCTNQKIRFCSEIYSSTFQKCMFCFVFLMQFGAKSLCMCEINLSISEFICTMHRFQGVQTVRKMLWWWSAGVYLCSYRWFNGVEILCVHVFRYCAFSPYKPYR